ncbi:PREDICTED: ubiquitin carboxyl-terminal hydrolase 22 [Tarenaya hassleriana]|uniref:ubiquitin carboxyl-terminal hydrolase 22 n=1 Tax=Tarenaya hassleriana TaxID=28532 RepID=UPI00053C3FB4|nr:PREDICTED: ubiquitin carboxyl-terminal hydrolase 22 [Tarenaya hassleriana]
MSGRISFLANPVPCHHLADYKLRYGTDGYNSFQNFFTAFKNGRTKIKLDHSDIPRCSSCGVLHDRLYICLICRLISCSSHTISHTQTRNGHDIAVDVERSELYCCSCCDQVYDPDFDEVVASKQLMGLGIPIKNGPDVAATRSSKKRRLDPELNGSKLVVLSRDRREKWAFPLGLRGLNNLGSTCFMNSVLQALVHAPPLRNFWLSGQHNRDLCLKRSVNRLCLLCDLDALFSAMFSGDRTPFSPVQFLYSWWQHSANLATYEQQDSHEFFISLLDGIHENDGKAKTLHQDHDEECQCITHRAFSGLLSSDVTCTSCGSTSTTYDPFVDISLTLDPANTTGFRRNRPDGPSETTTSSTLLGCLDFFTRPEKLGPDQKLYCQSCGEKKDSLKQMSIKRLPLVLCLHLKRFEHSLARKASRKIDRYLQYPFRLNMTPYLSSSVLGKKFGNRIFALERESEAAASSSSSTEFEIFAVITHSGMMESGHYFTYIRLKGMWYRCDDAWINEVDESVVRASECYMLFYAQEIVVQKALKGLGHLPDSDDDFAFPMAGLC